MAKFIASLKAIITRLVFGSHGFIAIWQVTTFKKNPIYWYLSCPIVLMVFEGVFTLTIKENQEWKWFCPSVFLYLGSVVPAIWLLELDKVDRRLRSRGANVNFTENLNLSNLAAEDLKYLEKAFGVNIRLPNFQISTETWVTLIEQFLMLILIIGRWMLPKGDLTRDQLSQLLLVYIGTAADIIEFFDSFKEDRVAREPVLVYLTLGIWAWSLMQFTVVLTATKSRKSRVSGGTVRRSVPTETSCCSIDIWGITLNMILQDGPFLAFRLILIIHYNIVSYMNIFFTCKNTLVILLQLYRLYVVQSGKRKGRIERKRLRERYEMNNISIISRGDMYKGTRSDGKRKAKKCKKDVVPNFSDSEDSEEEQDRYDLSPKDLKRHTRKSRQDTGYSTSSSRASYKHQENYDKEKGHRRVRTERSPSDEETQDQKSDSKAKVKKHSKNKNRLVRLKEQESSKKKNDQSRRKRKKEEISDDEEGSEESENSSEASESESEEEIKRYSRRKKRSNRN